MVNGERTGKDVEKKLPLPIPRALPALQ